MTVPRRALLLGAALLACLVLPPLAPAAGTRADPASQVLVYQPLFVGAGARLPTAQQAALGRQLTRLRRTNSPVRVAIIPRASDLGWLRRVWDKPQAYARLLGTELSLAYSGRLVVVMPTGIGVYWSGHRSVPGDAAVSRLAVRPGTSGLLAAAETAVGKLGPAAKGRLVSTSSPTATGSTGTTPTSSPAPVRAVSSGASSVTVRTLAIIVIVLGSLGLGGMLLVRRRSPGTGPHFSGAVMSAAPIAVIAGVLAIVLSGGGAPQNELATNSVLDPGTALAPTPAPNFTLTDQSGRRISLSSFRGKVVLLAFNDSECTTVCPLTTTAMLDAKKALGAAGSRVQLLGVDANPTATSIHDVLSYTEVHGLLGQWDFLTAPARRLRAVWNRYGIGVEIEHGQIDHTPALFVIDPQGRLRRVYLTQMSYAAVPQLGQLLAKETSSLLSGHPKVRTDLSYAQIPGTSPSTSTTVPRALGGSVPVGPSAGAKLYVFFATWDRQVLPLRRDLDALNGYAAVAGSAGLPAPVGVDEASVEPNSAALPALLRGLPHPLSYPVALDRAGRLADGYEVQDEPWFVLISATGRIAWYDDAGTSGWPSQKTLVAQIKAALSGAPAAPAGAASAARELAGSPAPLAALHAQGSQLLGGQPALTARVRSLRGYPIVVNAWAAWCTPCQKEFGLLASAAARYGTRVAFLGADSADSAGNARAFLAHHYVSYPSYQTDPGAIQSLFPAGLDGLPNTFFISPSGTVTHQHIGQYVSQGTLDQDIETYALGAS